MFVVSKKKGGVGCGAIPGTNGASDCCPDTIMEEAGEAVCGEAPCVMEGFTPSPVNPAATGTAAPVGEILVQNKRFFWFFINSQLDAEGLRLRFDRINTSFGFLSTVSQAFGVRGLRLRFDRMPLLVFLQQSVWCWRSSFEIWQNASLGVPSTVSLVGRSSIHPQSFVPCMIR